MKYLTVLVAIMSVAVAQRQPSRDVIEKFKEVAPKYLDLLKTGETELEKVRAEATDIVGTFHVDIITVKETFIVDAIRKESGMHFQIVNQLESVDATCLGFLNVSLDMSMNLAGSGFTNCINSADDAFNELAANYFKALGAQEGMLNELRLLDVFRGDNVFYTPQNIIGKLDKKLSDLTIDPESFAADLEEAKTILQNDLLAIISAYSGCMTQAQQMLKSGVDMLMMHLTFSCQGTAITPS